GATAPFVARYFANRGARAGWVFVVWQLLGILDLVDAIGVGASLRVLGAASGNTADAEQMVIVSQLPLSLIPAFAVPLFVIFHIAAIVQFRASRAPARAGTLGEVS